MSKKPSEITWGQLVLGLPVLALAGIGLARMVVSYDVTFKAGGGEFNDVEATLAGEVVKKGNVKLPWSKTVSTRDAPASMRVWSPRGPASWCEIWVNGELCDRDQDGGYCHCYRREYPLF